MAVPPPCPVRGAIVDQIRNHLEIPSAPPLFLHGPPSTGKQSTLLASLPPGAEDTTITVDCVLSHSDRLLFAAATGSTPCDATELVARLSDDGSEIATLIFQRAERLSGPAFSQGTLAILFALPELTQRPNLHVVLVSRASWPVFRRSLSVPVPDPVSITFAPYARTEIVSAISHSYESGDDQDRQALQRFAKAVVDTLHTSTTDLQELRSVVQELFPDYLKALRGTKDRVMAPVAAFNAIQARLHAALRALYRREVVVPRETQVAMARADRGLERPESRLAAWGLSRGSLTLLVAAFLASNNPPSQDVRYFTTERTRRAPRTSRGGRGRGRARGRGRGRGRGGRSAECSSGNSSSIVFPLERLLAIFAAIREDDAAGIGHESVSATVTTSSLVQISTLVGLKHLSKEGGGDPIAEPKYRCNLSLDQAVEIAQLVGIELDLYLHTECRSV